MALKGKSLLVKVSTTAGGAGTYNTVKGINSASVTVNGENIDISEFADTYRGRIQGLKDVGWEVSGFYSLVAGDRQVELRDALLNDTEIWMQILPDGTVGYKQQIKVASMEVSATPEGAVEVSFSLEGTGTLSTV